ncbi:MAG: DUF3047 domain-containing protein [Gemmatimonadota bacterium]
MSKQSMLTTRQLLICASALLAPAIWPPGHAGQLHAQENAAAASAHFSDGWEDRWENFGLGRKRTVYEVVLDDGGARVLMARSDGSASALLHRLRLPPAPSSRISWRWKIQNTLEGNRRERVKAGDDFVARLFVIFDGEPFKSESRALCYVWAASEPVGAVFENPYHAEVVTIVVDSGDGQAGQWVSRQRDFMKDFRDAFGRDPEFVSGVAFMVDTDNTHASARAWFDGMDIELGTS